MSEEKSLSSVAFKLIGHRSRPAHGSFDAQLCEQMNGRLILRMKHHLFNDPPFHRASNHPEAQLEEEFEDKA